MIGNDVLVGAQFDLQLSPKQLCDFKYQCTLWKWGHCCVLGQDTLVSHCISSPRSIIKLWVLVNLMLEVNPIKLECRINLTLWKQCSRGFEGSLSWTFPGTLETQATHLVKHCWTDMSTESWRRREILRLWTMIKFRFVFWLWCLMMCSNTQLNWQACQISKLQCIWFSYFLSYSLLSFCHWISRQWELCRWYMSCLYIGLTFELPPKMHYRNRSRTVINSYKNITTIICAKNNTANIVT